jgi:hypothetical protein
MFVNLTWWSVFVNLTGGGSLEGDGGLAGDDASLPHLSPNPHPNPMNSPRQGMRGLGFSERKKEI